MTAKKVHFIGIGGSSMNGLAQILHKNGCTVSGSDREQSAATERLQAAGIEVKIPQSAQNIEPDCQLVVYTDAVMPDNPEYAQAVKMKIPMMGRALLIKELTAAYTRTICVAGSHGKTTTSALLACVATEAGLDPTVNFGGYMPNGMSNRIGSSPYFILEACEYKNNFLQWHPFVGTILNIDADHIDFYGGMDGLVDSFASFAKNIHPQGALVIHSETQGIERIIKGLECRVVEYGMNHKARHGDTFFSPASISFSPDGRPSFDVMKNGEALTRVDLPLYGEHNILNALACFCVGEVLGIAPETTARGLEKSQGVKRRYEHKGYFNDVPIIDDYAHHPTEIRACLAAARRRHNGRIVCVFQPHLYSRTRDLFEDFAHSFSDADKILFLPIYAAREAHDANISSEMLCEFVRGLGKNVECFENFYSIEHRLREILTTGDLLITVGAGNVHLVGESLL